MHFFENLVETVVIPRQGGAQHVQPSIHVFQALSREPAGVPRALDPADDEAGILKHPKVAGNRRLRHLEGSRQLHHRGFAERQPSQDGSPGGIGKGGEDGVEIFRSGIHIKI